MWAEMETLRIIHNKEDMLYRNRNAIIISFFFSLSLFKSVEMTGETKKSAASNKAARSFIRQTFRLFSVFDKQQEKRKRPFFSFIQCFDSCKKKKYVRRRVRRVRALQEGNRSSVK